MLSARQKKNLTRRIRSAAGQLAAIERMIDDDRPAAEIHTQLLAVGAALGGSMIAAFEDEQRRALAALIVERQEACPGPGCALCDLVREIRTRFPRLAIREVLQHIATLERQDGEGIASSSSTPSPSP
jgi:DNA-binding FrmR family transcriptional regulator